MISTLQCKANISLKQKNFLAGVSLHWNIFNL